MTIKVQITEDGRTAFESELKPKTYSTGKKGFYARATIILSNKVHNGNIMFYEAQK